MLENIKKIFLKKQQSITNSQINNSVVLQIDGDFKLDEKLSHLLVDQNADKVVLNQLVEEKLENAVEFVTEGKYSNSSLILDTIYTASIKSLSIENKNLLHYLKALICILEDKIEQAKLTSEFLGDSSLYRKNILNAIHIKSEGTANIIITDDLKADSIYSCFILQILFDKAEYDLIISNFEPTDNSFHCQDYFYAVSSLNCNNYVESIQALDKAIKKKYVAKYSFCNILSQIIFNISQIQEKDIDFVILDSLYHKLSEVGNSCPEFRNSNLTIYNITKLRVLLILKPEEFLDEYSKLVPEQKINIVFRYQLATYYMIKEQFEDAIKIFKEIYLEDPSPEISYKVMICYLGQNKYLELINYFEEIELPHISAEITIYLIAIHNETPDKFDILFDKYFSVSCNVVEDLSFFLDICRYSKHAKEAIYNMTKKMKNEILCKNNTQIISFAVLAAEMSDMNLSEFFLTSINKYFSKDLELVYFLLMQISDPKIREEVAKWFIDNNLKTEKILNILSECYMDCKKYSSAFTLLQESFLLSEEKRVAVNLINIAALIDTVEIEDIQKYLDFVSGSKEPMVLLIAAQTYCKFKFYDIAEKLSYSAIYLLNNYDDNFLYKLYLSTHFKMISGDSENNIDFERVTDNVVVVLESSDANRAGKDASLNICINQEAEYCNDIEAIGVLHISKSNLLYLKIINRGLQDTIEHNGLLYTIKSIVNKYVFTFRYVLSKIDDLSDDFVLKKIYMDKNKDAREQMQEILQELGPTSNLIESYHFKDNSIGLPIECINQCVYDDYVQVVKILLYSKDEVLYAGLNNIEFDTNHNYAVTLSTLVILSILDNLSLLEQFCSVIYISDTLLNFIKERSENASKILINSPGKIGLNEDGSIVLTPPDKSMPDFWNSIYEIALKFNRCNISSADRSGFCKTHADIDVEVFFEKMRIHISQFDSFIVAQKYSSILLSDDLFFRRFGYSLGIRSVNHTYLYSNTKKDNLKVELKKLISTNYLFIPPIDDHTHAIEYFKSITSNERKRKAYAELLPHDSV